MRFLFSLLPLLVVLGWSGMTHTEPQEPEYPPAATFYDLTVGGLEGGTIRMADYRGKMVLCVNVASNCGYTPQYKALQELQDRFRDHLVVIGFPCNQFLGQEPGTPAEIATFCEKNYGVTFPLSEKIDVKGLNQHPVYRWLTTQPLNGESTHEVKWNFHKFLVSPDGRLIGSWRSKVEPLDPEILTMIGS